jgi:nicotinate-nucleotide--dimethylbenzimidazole phosphoribosyltransferase
VTALLELGAGVGWVDAEAADAARRRTDADAGRLAQLVEWLSGTRGRYPPDPLRRVRCLVLGEPGATVRRLADDLDVGLVAVDPTAGFPAGVAAADDEIEAGAELLVLAAPDDTPSPATLIGVLTGAEPVALLPRGVEAIDSPAWIARAVALRDARARVAGLRARPDELLEALGSPRVAAAAGVALQAAVRRTGVVLDGTAVLAGALLCLDIQSRASQWWQIAGTSDERAHRRAVESLGLRPVLDLGVRGGDGTAGLLAVAVLRAATPVVAAA